MKPRILCLMQSSIDGGLHPSRYTESPQGDAERWGTLYESIHDDLGGDGWIVGRVTMAEMSKADAHPPADVGKVERPVHVAARSDAYAIALDPSGKLHFDGATVNGDHALVLLGPDVSDGHLAELAADGVSYVVADGDPIDLVAMTETLADRFGIRTLLLEGGGRINGAFLAAGLVDELHVLVAPAFDGAEDFETVAVHKDGLKGRVRLALKDVRRRDHGTVHLIYDVAKP